MRLGCLSSRARRVCDPAMGDQVADEAAGRLEPLPGLGGRRIDQVIAQQITVRPKVLVAGQAELPQPSFQCGIHDRTLARLMEGCRHFRVFEMKGQIISVSCVWQSG